MAGEVCVAVNVVWKRRHWITWWGRLGTTRQVDQLLNRVVYGTDFDLPPGAKRESIDVVGTKNHPWSYECCCASGDWISSRFGGRRSCDIWWWFGTLMWKLSGSVQYKQDSAGDLPPMCVCVIRTGLTIKHTEHVLRTLQVKGYNDFIFLKLFSQSYVLRSSLINFLINALFFITF